MINALDGFTLHASLNEAPTVIVVTLWSGGMTWQGCIDSLLRFTSPELPICVWDDAGPSTSALNVLIELEKKYSREVFYHRHSRNLGVVGNLNHAFDAFEHSNVIVLNSDTIVGPQWDTSLTDIAASRTDIATVTALSNGGGLFGIGEINQLGSRIPTVDEFAAVANKVRENSPKIRPIVPTATSFCTLFTRQALNIAGKLDPEFSPGYGEEVDFSLRSSSYGFVHVAADDVLVFHATGESFGDVAQNTRKAHNDELVSRRFPFWQDLIDDFLANEDSTLQRSKNVAVVSCSGLRIAIDAENMNPDLTGTFEGSSRLIWALWQHPMVLSITLIAPLHSLERLTNWAEKHTNSKVKVISVHDIDYEISFDIAFRPYQDYSGETWPAIKRLGKRNIVWHLDLIASHNPTYSLDFENFISLSKAVQTSLDEADAIGVLTKHVEEDLRSFYGGRGLDEKIFKLENGPTRALNLQEPQPDVFSFEEGEDEPYILVLGTNYRHKNITWLMRVFLIVRELGWVGKMVIVGPTPTRGGTAEEDFLLARSSLPEAFNFLGRVEDSKKLSILRGAKLVVVPSITEGWGLVPLEAALEGVPPLTTDGGGLRDIKPGNAEKINLSSDLKSAELIYQLLTDPALSKSQLDAWTSNVKQLDWSNSANSLVKAALHSLSRASWNRPVVDEKFYLYPETQESGSQNKIQPAVDSLFRISTFIFPLESRRRRMLKSVFPSIRHTGTKNV